MITSYGLGRHAHMFYEMKNHSRDMSQALLCSVSASDILYTGPVIDVVWVESFLEDRCRKGLG